MYYLRTGDHLEFVLSSNIFMHCTLLLHLVNATTGGL